MRTNRGSRIGLYAAVAVSAIGLLALGLLSLAYGDLLLQWQPAPKTAPWRAPLAHLSGVILLTAGTGLLVARFRKLFAALGSAWIALWVIFLHVPVAIVMKASVASLLGVAECLAMALGLATLALADARSLKRVLVALFGICCIVFGISHFVYADFTATMVPAWLPARLALAYLTGAVHALTGLCLLFGIAVRIAAFIEASMMTSFVVLLHLPRVMETPSNRLELTMLAIATLLTGAAWLVAASARGAVRVERASGSICHEQERGSSMLARTPERKPSEG